MAVSHMLDCTLSNSHIRNIETSGTSEIYPSMRRRITEEVKRSGGITDQLHAPAALSMGKKPPALTGEKSG